MFKNGIEYIVRAHSKNMNSSLMHARQMKRIVNASQNYALLMFKHEDVVNEEFQGNASNENSDFIEVSNGYDNIFQESNVLHEKIGQQDLEKLQQHA